MKRKRENATVRSRFRPGPATGSRTLALCGIALLTAKLCLGADITIEASSNRDHVFLEEDFNLIVRVSGTSANIKPDVSKIQHCSIEYLGSKDESYKRTTIIQGKVKNSSFSGRTHAYRIAPSSAGVFTAGPISITARGKNVSTTGPKVNVIGVAKHESVRLSISSSKNDVLINEPFEITISVALKRLPGRYSNLDPLDPRKPPHLYSPHLYPAREEGLDRDDMVEKIGKLLASGSRRTGFYINDYTLEAEPMDRLFRLGQVVQEKPAKIMFPRSEKTYSSVKYYEYSFTTRYVPRTEGVYSFGPSTFKGQIISEIRPSGHVVSKPIYVACNPAEVTVKPPPAENRPYSYIAGAVGKEMAAKAELDAQTCRVSDPLTLTLTISGDMYLNYILKPDIAQQPNLNKSFKIYDDTVELNDDGKIFRYVVRPLKAGTQELPPIALSYYDSEDLQYKTVYTEAIPLRVNETTRIINEAILNTSTNSLETAGKKKPDNARKPAPINMNDSGTIHQPIRFSRHHGILMGAGPALYFLIVFISFLRKKTTRDPMQEKSRKALKSALRILRTKKEDRVSRAMMTLIADRSGMSISGMTPPDAKYILQKNKVSPQLIESYCDALQDHFNRTYKDDTEASAAASEEVVEISRLMKEIDRAMPHKKQYSSKKPMSHIVLALTMILVAHIPVDSKASAIEIERRFLWNQALLKVQTASTQKDFLEAASAYNELIERGTANGQIFYNAATAYLLAEEYEEAMNNLVRAERHLGSNWAIRRNMIIAMSGEDEDKDVSLPWSRLIFFWHFGLSAFARMNIAAISFSLVWIGLAIARLGLKTTGRTIAITSLILFALYGSSIANSMQKEANAIKRFRTITTKDIET